MDAPSSTTEPDARLHRIFIVEDHWRLRTLLKTFIGMQPDMDCCGVADCAETALDVLDYDSLPDLVVADLSLPGMSGVDLIRLLRETNPSLRCLVLSGHDNARYASAALHVGARGYILKGDPLEIGQAIRRCCDGEIVVSEDLSE